MQRMTERLGEGFRDVDDLGADAEHGDQPAHLLDIPADDRLAALVERIGGDLCRHIRIAVAVTADP